MKHRCGCGMEFNTSIGLGVHQTCKHYDAGVDLTITKALIEEGKHIEEYIGKRLIDTMKQKGDHNTRLFQITIHPIAWSKATLGQVVCGNDNLMGQIRPAMERLKKDKEGFFRSLIPWKPRKKHGV